MGKENEVEGYPLQIIEQYHGDTLGYLASSSITCKPWLSPKDTISGEFCYFNVRIEKRFFDDKKRLILSLHTCQIFKIFVGGNMIPNEKFLFSIVEVAFKEFSRVYEKMSKGTNAEIHKIKEPEPDLMSDSIHKCIADWKMLGQHISIN